MSDLLREQIDNAMYQVQTRDRYRLVAPVEDFGGKSEREEYDKETLQMHRDCHKAQEWLKSCQQ